MGLIDVFTHCKGCVFARKKLDLDGNLCDFDRLTAFKATEIVDGYYKFGRFCNTYRPQEWLDKVEGEPSYQAILESDIKMGLTINFCGAELIDLDATLSEAFRGMKPTYVIVINDKPEYNKEIYQMVASYGLHPSRIHIVQIINKEEKYYLDEAFRFARPGYMTYVYAGDELPENYINTINNYVNIEMKFFSLCFSSDGKMIFQTQLFKLLNGNYPKAQGDGAFDNDCFVDKVLKMKGADNCVHLWEKFFE